MRTARSLAPTFGFSTLLSCARSTTRHMTSSCNCPRQGSATPLAKHQHRKLLAESCDLVSCRSSLELGFNVYKLLRRLIHSQVSAKCSQYQSDARAASRFEWRSRSHAWSVDWSKFSSFSASINQRSLGKHGKPQARKGAPFSNAGQLPLPVAAPEHQTPERHNRR